MRRERFIAGNTATVSIGPRTGLPGVPDRSVPEYMTHVTAIATLIRVVTTALVLIAGIMAAPGPAAAGEYPTDFISALGNQGLAVIRSNATIDQKAAYFHQMLRQDFDLARISRFGLGPYWRIASETEQQEFASLLEDHLVRFYGRRFAVWRGKLAGNRQPGRPRWRHRDEPDHSPAGIADRSRVAARPERWPLQDQRRHC